MKTPWYDTEISQEAKTNYTPYGLNRQELDTAAGAIASATIKRRVNGQTLESTAQQTWLELWSANNKK